MMSTDNNTDADGLHLPQVSITLRIVQVTSLVLLIALGLLGNFILCFVVYKTRNLWTVPNLLIVNLSVSDLLRIVFSLSVSCAVLTTRRWIGDLFCQINGFYTLVFLSSSLLCVTLISINRYFLIVKPNKSKQIFSRRNTRYMVGGLWSIGIVTAFPPLLGLGMYGFNASRATCFIAYGSSNSYTSILVLILIGAPFSVTIWCYIRVYIAIKHSKERVTVNNISPTVPPNHSTKRKLSQREVSIILDRFLSTVFSIIVTW